MSNWLQEFSISSLRADILQRTEDFACNFHRAHFAKIKLIYCNRPLSSYKQDMCSYFFFHFYSCSLCFFILKYVCMYVCMYLLIYCVHVSMKHRCGVRNNSSFAYWHGVSIVLLLGCTLQASWLTGFCVNLSCCCRNAAVAYTLHCSEFFMWNLGIRLVSSGLFSYTLNHILIYRALERFLGLFFVLFRFSKPGFLSLSVQ